MLEIIKDFYKAISIIDLMYLILTILYFLYHCAQSAKDMRLKDGELVENLG